MKYLLCVLTLTVSLNSVANLSQQEFDQSQAIYNTYCLSCHGEDMDGNGGAISAKFHEIPICYCL